MFKELIDRVVDGIAGSKLLISKSQYKKNLDAQPPKSKGCVSEGSTSSEASISDLGYSHRQNYRKMV